MSGWRNRACGVMQRPQQNRQRDMERRIRKAAFETLEKRILMDITASTSSSLIGVEAQLTSEGNLDTSGSIVVGTGTTVAADRVRASAVTVNGTLRIVASANGAWSATRASVVTDLTIANTTGTYTGQLDLTNNALIIEPSAGEDPQTVLTATIQALKSGYDSGNWDGNGIISSLAAKDNSHYSVGVILNKNSDGSPAYTTFAGQAGLTASDIIVAYTTVGDANLDGTSNTLDNTIISNNYGSTNAYWAMGDFNYDSHVNLSDLTQFSSNSGRSTALSADTDSYALPKYLSAFSDSNGDKLPADFAATVNWGDGSSTTAGYIFEDKSGQLYVLGSHVYQATGTYSVGFTINNTLHTSSASANVTDTFVVADAPVSGTGTSLTTVSAGNSITSQTVANFTDANSTSTTNGFTASINWGDGSNSSGAIVSDGSGKFHITGSHTYSASNSYTAQVTVNDVNGSTTGSIATQVNAPAAPTSLSGTFSGNSVALSWTAPTVHGASISGYNIYRGSVLVGTSTTASYTDANVVPNGSYSYTVSAYDSNQLVSAQSTALSAVLPPAAPTNVTAYAIPDGSAPSGWDAQLTWDAVPGANRYWIYRSTTSGGEGSTAYFQSTNSSTTYTDTNVAAGTTYYYQVVANHRVGTTNKLGVASFEVSTAHTAPSGAPAAPTNLFADITDPSTNTLSLTWNWPSSGTYVIQQSPDGLGSWTNVSWTGSASFDSGSQTETVTQTGITQKFYYRVAATNGFGNSDWTNTSAPNNSLFTRTIGVSFQVTSTPSVQLSWAGDPAALYYQIYRRVSGTSSWGAPIGSAVGTATGWTDTAITTGIVYQYQVQEGYLDAGASVAYQTGFASMLQANHVNENSGVSNTQVVGQLTTDPSLSTSSYTASIDWGDGTSNSGTISASNGVWSINGARSYSVLGNFADIVTVSRSGTVVYTASGSVTVEPPLPAPAAASVPEPADIANNTAPTAPAGYNTYYSPPVGTVTISSSAPVIAAANSIAGPDNNLTVTGTNFSAYSGTNAYSDSRFIVYGQSGASAGTFSDAAIHDISTLAAVLSIDPSEPANSMYMLWPVNNADNSSATGNVGAPIMVNRTRATWVGPTSVIAGQSGQTTSVFGQNLTNGAGQSWVYIQPDSATKTSGEIGQWATVTTANPYKVDFTVPTSLVAGEKYDIWVNNGMGGNYGWSVAGTSAGGTTLNPITNPFNSTQISVTTYGADNTGASDSTAAINTAISHLSSGNTLYFPAGTYLVSSTTSTLSAIPSNIRVQGSTNTSSPSTIQFTQAPSSLHSEISVTASGSNVEFDNLTLSYTGSNPGYWAFLTSVDGNTNVVFNQVNLNAVSLTPIDTSWASGLAVKNSTLKGIGIGGYLTHDAIFDNDHFFVGFQTNDALAFTGGHDISVSNSTMNNMGATDSSNSNDYGKGGFFENSRSAGSVYNEYVGGNVTQINTGGDGGQQVLFEGGVSSEAFGTPTSVSNTYTNGIVTLTTSSTISADDVVEVIAGPGLGQERIVTGVTSGGGSVTLTLDSPWTINPSTSSSTIMVQHSYHDINVYHNTLADNPTSAHYQGGSVGVDVYDGGSQIVIDGNTTINTSGGVAINSMSHNLSYFDELINNKMYNIVANGNSDPTAAIGLLSALSSPYVNLVGTIIRNNNIDVAPVGVVWPSNLRPIGIFTELLGYKTPVSFAAIEHNTIQDTPAAVMTLESDPDLVVYANTFIAGSVGSSASGILFENSSPAALLERNSYSGFASNYAYAVSGTTFTNPVLNSSNRVFFLTVPASGSASINMPLWDDGASSVSWSQATNTYTLGSGTITAESSSSPSISVTNPGSTTQLTKYTLTINYGTSSVLILTLFVYLV